MESDINCEGSGPNASPHLVLRIFKQVLVWGHAVSLEFATWHAESHRRLDSEREEGGGERDFVRSGSLSWNRRCTFVYC